MVGCWLVGLSSSEAHVSQVIDGSQALKGCTISEAELQDPKSLESNRCKIDLTTADERDPTARSKILPDELT